MQLSPTDWTACLAALAGEGAPRWRGEVTSIEAGALTIAGLGGVARLGDHWRIEGEAGAVLLAETIALKDDVAIALPFDAPRGVRVGAVAELTVAGRFVSPSLAWRGALLDWRGFSVDGQPAPQGAAPTLLEGRAPPAARRKRLGPRLSTTLNAFDAFLPLCVGQRIGLFAGSGVGKSTLLAALARHVEADVVVVALIGERGREVRAFVEDTLGEEGRRRAVVIASTSDEPALAKKRAAYLAMATAERFRDDGLSVMLLFDSVTRFADAHREIALAAGEPPSLHAYPPSTVSAIASLVERAGPGTEGAGDITAVFSVLVAGSDMEGPVADMVRGLIDGHVVLDRAIAERGRFPAIDVRRSVSRSLPDAATSSENQLLREARAHLGVYEDAEMIVRAGLYQQGSDRRVDAALKAWPDLDAFIAERDPRGPSGAFEQLETILAKAR